MITLGLDPSLTAFGWCVHDSSQVGPARVVERGRFATPASDVFVKRYKDLRCAVNELLDRFPQIEGVGVESTAFGEMYSEGMYALFTHVNEALYDHRKDVIHFDPLTVKLLVKQDPKVKQGKMFKSDMVDAAKADTGTTGRFNHNEADAYHIARFAARFWELHRGLITGDDLTPSEQHVFLRQHTYTRGKRAGETEKLGAMFRENDRFFRFSLLEPRHHGECSERKGREGQQGSEGGGSAPEEGARSRKGKGAR